MKSEGVKILSENRRARFDYEISETFEAGIELTGIEVKSARMGYMGLAGSYGIVRNGQLWLLNAQIPPYQPGNTPATYDPARSRRLLFRKKEIDRIEGKLGEKFVLVPLEAHLSHGLVKIKMAIARPRKKEDKRDYLKKRDSEREMRGAF